MSAAPHSDVPNGNSESQSLLSVRQDQIERKYAQVQTQRQNPHTVRLEAKQKRRNKEADQQILLLMQTDERLASLLSEAADSLRALLPSSDSQTNSQHGAKAFEGKTQQWFSILNEVQYSLRTAVRHLRDAQLAPITTPCTSEARQSGLAGSAGRGHSVSLLQAFVDVSNAENSTDKLHENPSSTAPLPELQLSLQALRERDQAWTELSRSLEEISKTYSTSSTSQSPTKESDKLLLSALLNDRLE